MNNEWGQEEAENMVGAFIVPPYIANPEFGLGLIILTRERLLGEGGWHLFGTWENGSSFIFSKRDFRMKKLGILEEML